MTKVDFNKVSSLVNEYDLYKLLDVNESISDEDLKIHFEENISNKYNPSKFSFKLISGKNSKELALVFNKMNEAYGILSNLENRAKYNELRKSIIDNYKGTNISSKLQSVYNLLTVSIQDKPYMHKLYVLKEEDYYAILGIDSDVEQRYLVNNYESLVGKYDPLKYSFKLMNSTEINNLHAVYSRISVAYSTLSNRDKRKAYDQERKEIEDFGLNIVKETTVKPTIKTNDLSKKEGNAKLARSLYEQGFEHLNKGQIDEAINKFRVATEKDPKNANYYAYLGLAMEKKGWGSFAQSQYKIALSHDPKNQTALKKLNIKRGIFSKLFGK